MDVFKLKGPAIVLGVFFLCSAIGLTCIVLGGRDSYASTEIKQYKEAYELYKANCLGCHDTVADPEKPGRTRDEWFVVVNVMHDYGLDLTKEQSGMIVDLLYALRKGIERDPG